MSYYQVISLNIFSTLASFALPESFFQLSLLLVSIILTIIKCVEMIISIRIRRNELRKIRTETMSQPKKKR